jgi:hypothetical protein
MPPTEPSPQIFTFRFGAGEEGNQYLRSGWYAPEDGFVWSRGRYATVHLTAPVARGVIVIEGWGYAGGPDLPEPMPQEVMIFLNGIFLGLHDMRDRGGRNLPFDVPRREIAEIGFVILDPKRPIDVENIDDSRLLGLSLQSIYISSYREDENPADPKAKAGRGSGFREIRR